jgi:4'-phosphopantetheinyl transferase
VAGAGTRLGCDVEQVGERSRAFVEDYFTDAERAVLDAADPGERGRIATLIWSAKESALKARRTGLRADTRTVQVRFSGSASDRVWQPLEVLATQEPAPLRGFWLAPEGLVITLVADPAPAVPIRLIPF